MKEQERTQVATQIADLLNGLSLEDAYNIIGEAIIAHCERSAIVTGCTSIAKRE